MAAVDLAREYISRVNGQEAEAVAELFAADGEIVDPMGKIHRGREAIREFVLAAAPHTLSQIADREIGGERVVFRGIVTTGHLPPAQVEWIFEVQRGAIQRLTIGMLRVW